MSLVLGRPCQQYGAHTLHLHLGSSGHRLHQLTEAGGSSFGSGVHGGSCSEPEPEADLALALCGAGAGRLPDPADGAPPGPAGPGLSSKFPPRSRRKGHCVAGSVASPRTGPRMAAYCVTHGRRLGQGAWAFETEWLLAGSSPLGNGEYAGACQGGHCATTWARAWAALRLHSGGAGGPRGRSAVESIFSARRLAMSGEASWSAPQVGGGTGVPSSWSVPQAGPAGPCEAPGAAPAAPQAGAVSTEGGDGAFPGGSVASLRLLGFTWWPASVCAVSGSRRPDVPSATESTWSDSVGTPGAGAGVPVLLFSEARTCINCLAVVKSPWAAACRSCCCRSLSAVAVTASPSCVAEPAAAGVSCPDARRPACKRAASASRSDSTEPITVITAGPGPGATGNQGS